MDLLDAGDSDGPARVPVEPSITTVSQVRRRSCGARVSHSAAVRRKFNQNIKMWSSMFPIDAATPGLGTWIASKRSERQGFRVGCLVCAIARASGRYAAFQVTTCAALSAQHLQQHAASKVHRAAASLVVLHGNVVDNATAPSKQQFQDVLGDCLKGVPDSGHDGVGCQLKLKQMSWCLSEAVLKQDRDALKRAASITIHQYAAAPHLLVRFTASMPDLSVRRGFLGVAKDSGTTSEHIRQATEQVLNDFCTPRLSPPGKHTAQCQGLDPELQAAIQKRVHVFDADGAADEQRAGRLLMTSSCGSPAVFPHIDTLMRDQAHASRRQGPGRYMPLLKPSFSVWCRGRS